MDEYLGKQPAFIMQQRLGAAAKLTTVAFHAFKNFGTRNTTKQ